MIAASIPLAATTAVSKQRERKPWTPDDRDHLIYRWVKLVGHTQDWVAQQLEISQSTISRLIQRYERWQAHAQPGQDGRLDHEERLRAQRWLTYERNEVLLASALRIAGEMERFVDISKSTIRRGNSYTAERDVTTQNTCVDRSGLAARVLRLAFRINMEQLKLVEKDPLPPLPPLTSDEDGGEVPADAAPIDASDHNDTDCEESAIAGRVNTDASFNQQPQAQAESPDTVAPRSPSHDVGDSRHANVHKVHNASPTEIGITPTPAHSSARSARRKKSLAHACMPAAGASPQRDQRWEPGNESAPADGVEAQPHNPLYCMNANPTQPSPSVAIRAAGSGAVFQHPEP